MSCPDPNAKKACAQHGSSGVIAPPFPTQAEFFNSEVRKREYKTKSEAWNKREIGKKYVDLVLKTLLAGGLSEQQVEGLLNLQDAAYCKSMSATIRKDAITSIRLWRRLLRASF